MHNGWEKVSKRDWYANGGFSDSHNARRHNGRCWVYYYVWY